MSKKVSIILIIALMALVSCVTAETLTGTLGADNYNSTNWTSPVTGSHYLTGGTKIDANPFQNTDGMVAIDVYYTTGAVFDSGAPAGTAVPFTAYLANASAVSTNQSGVIIGTGYIGYQRLFAVGGAEYGGHLWVQFDTYDTKGYTGQQYLYLEYDKAAFYNFNLQSETGTGAPAGYFIWDAGNAGTYAIAGDYTEVKHNPVFADYTATKPGGIGINGAITKTTGLSQAFVVNAAGTTVASEATLSNATLNYSVSSEQIKIGIYSLSGWYNTSLLFSPGVTPTPTVTPTPEPTIPPGYIRSWVTAWDTNANTVNGANIDIYDIEAAVWDNHTHSSGIVYIDTLPYHTLNIYGSYDIFANEFSDAELLGVETGYYGTHFWITMYPYQEAPAAGLLNLYVTVLENFSKQPVTNADIRIDITGQSTVIGSSGSSGTGVLVVPNETVMHITVTKAGWLGNTLAFETGTGPSDSVTIGIDKALVTSTPTTTIPPGGVTPAVTVDARTNPQKAEGVMNILYNNGESIVTVCVLMTVLGLLGIKFGK